MHRVLLLVFSLLALTTRGALPGELEAALKTFRADPPPGWSFTQTSRSASESLVERCNAARPEFDRWTLVEKNGRPPTAADRQAYGETRSRRSRAGTAPKITDQIDITSIEKVSETPERVTYRARLAPGESRDATAAHLRATLVVHRPTRTLESFELASIEAFSPTLGVRISEMKTTMTYALPAGAAPALPQSVATRVRGRAFLFKSLDAEMTVTFSDYVRVPGR